MGGGGCQAHSGFLKLGSCASLPAAAEGVLFTWERHWAHSCQKQNRGRSATGLARGQTSCFAWLRPQVQSPTLTKSFLFIEQVQAEMTERVAHLVTCRDCHAQGPRFKPLAPPPPPPWGEAS